MTWSQYLLPWWYIKNRFLNTYNDNCFNKMSWIPIKWKAGLWTRNYKIVSLSRNGTFRINCLASLISLKILQHHHTIFNRAELQPWLKPRQKWSDTCIRKFLRNLVNGLSRHDDIHARAWLLSYYIWLQYDIVAEKYIDNFLDCQHRSRCHKRVVFSENSRELRRKQLELFILRYQRNHS